MSRKSSVSEKGAGIRAQGSGPTTIGSRQNVTALVEDVAARLSALEDARREANDLVAALLDVPKNWPMLHANKWVEAHVWQRARDAADIRASGAPIAYAVGRANFREL